MWTDIRSLACFLLSVGLVMAAASPGHSSPVSLTEVRPPAVGVGASVEVTLVGSGFADTCRAWVRAADLTERSVPAVLRSGTQMTILVGGELTDRPRTLEFQVRCTYTTVAGTRIDRTEWRQLTVRPLVLTIPTPEPIGPPRRFPAAPSDVRASLTGQRIPNPHWRFEVIWRDNSDNENGFNVYLLHPGGGGATITRPRNSTSLTVNWVPHLISCDLLYEVAVTAFNASGESARAATTVRASPCP
ncbi:MAG: hypothetical protein QME77_10655 [bacterium]|nr:hypothetical protein [bacterium]